MKESILTAVDIKKTFTDPRPLPILQGVTLNIRPAETIAIIGASGSGKSTLLHILGTLESASSGKLYYYGDEITKHDYATFRNKHFGFIFQMSHLLDEYSLLSNLLLKAKIARKQTKPGSDAYKEALHLIEKVQLSHRLDFPVKFLSGGEKQRAAIARAFMNDPDLILADEPTGNLDNESSLIIQEMLLTFCSELNKSLIVVTHDRTFAARCDRTLHLNQGRLA